jgi:hypothetical protein
LTWNYSFLQIRKRTFGHADSSLHINL